MKTILSAVLFASFLLSGPAVALAGDAEAKKETAPAKPADAKGPVKKDGAKTGDDAARTRGK